MKESLIRFSMGFVAGFLIVFTRQLAIAKMTTGLWFMAGFMLTTVVILTVLVVRKWRKGRGE